MQPSRKNYSVDSRHGALVQVRGKAMTARRLPVAAKGRSFDASDIGIGPALKSLVGAAGGEYLAGRVAFAPAFIPAHEN